MRRSNWFGVHRCSVPLVVVWTGRGPIPHLANLEATVREVLPG